MNEFIVIDPGICNGRPTVRGKRVAVQSVLEFLAAGDTVDDLLAAFPVLTREEVQACLAFASRLMARNFTVVPTP